MQRKEEIKENIESQTAEMEQLKQTNAQLQAKVKGDIQTGGSREALGVCA